MTTIRLPVAVACLSLAPFAAQAEITPDDVWDNIGAVVSAVGGHLDADLSHSGNAITATDVSIRFDLPLNAGSIRMGAGTLTLTAQDDGTVALGGPASQDVSMGFDIPAVGSGTLTVRYSVTDYTNVASGTPGDITYTADVGRYDVTFGDVDLQGELAEEAGEFRAEGGMSAVDVTSTTRVIVGDLVTLLQTSTVGETTFDGTFEGTLPDGGDTIATRSWTEMGSITGVAEMRLPAQGIAVMALGAALRDGLFASYSYTGEGQSSGQESFLNGELVTSQATTVGGLGGEFRLGAGGLQVSASAANYAVQFEQPLLFPMPLAGSAADVSMDLSLPLLRTGDTQDMNLALAFRGVEFDPDLWSLFDPGAQLPRDPAEMKLDMSMGLMLDVDLVDVPALMELEEAGTAPLRVISVDLRELAATAVGSAASVAGAVTFDHDDLATFDGMPAPDGTITVRVWGAEALLGRLQEMGLVSTKDLRGARLVIGGFSRPGEAADERVSEIVLDGSAGTITANGQRIK